MLFIVFFYWARQSLTLPETRDYLPPGLLQTISSYEVFAGSHNQKHQFPTAETTRVPPTTEAQSGNWDFCHEESKGSSDGLVWLTALRAWFWWLHCCLFLGQHLHMIWKFWQVGPHAPEVLRTSNPKAHLPLTSFPSDFICTVSLTPDQHLKLIFSNILTFESPGSPAITHMASPHAYTAWFSYCGVRPENLRLWQVPRRCWCYQS
jgi:hypothetical protein